ncbi:putative transcription factor C2H2 family [Helianthus annuus]|nr:putative transcription factor C2H2 family [Helianthus annuus]
MSADSPVMSPWLDSESQDTPIPIPYSFNQKLMFVIIMMLFIVMCLSFLFKDTRHPNRHNRPTHIVYIINDNRPLASCPSGLNASILKSLPLFVYSTETKTNADVVDCVVCLSEFENGDKCRVLPNCKHCFHIGCIDMWFYNHSTCPLCRSPVEPKSAPEPGSSASSIETTLEEDRRERVDVIIDVPVNESVTGPS